MAGSGLPGGEGSRAVKPSYVALLQTLASWILGAVFIYASYDKILQPGEFARIIYRYQLVGPNDVIPALLPNMIAVTLPWIELLTGLLLVFGVWRREAALTAGGLLVVFIIAVASTLVRGVDVQNCGCFSLGPEGRQAGGGLILGDLLLLAMAAAVFKWSGPGANAAPQEGS